MPVTTRYSATFDRPYEEEQNSAPAPSNGMRRSRSQSWQANSGLNGRPYSPFENYRSSQRSSSTDCEPTKSTETIPTRTLAKPVVKTHNNPFQFVAVGKSPLFKKAEEQLKKVKEVKKVEVLKEEEEEWQTNLDSWKSRRRKMSEDVFRRQEEIRQFELEQQQQSDQANQKKIKTFSEMVEARAHRGRTLSLCLISSPLENLELENGNSKGNGTHPYSEGSEENSAVNSEDEGIGKGVIRRNFINKKAQSTENILSADTMTPRNKFFELSENGHSPNNGSCFDSGLESISSSHKPSDTPDSCSDFSQDSGSCVDCDSPRVSGLVLSEVNLLEKLNANDLLNSVSHNSLKENSSVNSEDPSKNELSGFLSDIQSDKSEILSSISDGSDITLCVASDANNNSKTDKLCNKSFIQVDDKCLKNSQTVFDSTEENLKVEESCLKQERSVESENEVFVDDFEEIHVNKSNLLSTLSSPDSISENENNELKKENLSSYSMLSQSGLFEIKLATVVQASDEIDEATELMENISLATNFSKPSLPSVSEFDSSNDQTLPQNGILNFTVLHSDDENTNVIVKIKKPKNKNSKKKKASKSSDNNKISSLVTSLNLDTEELNVVFQSKNPKEDSTNKKEVAKSESYFKEKIVLKDVPPIDEVTEQMERFILQQLEEQEKEKDILSKTIANDSFNSPEHTIFRSRSTEPPKEKPPPPPCEENETPKSTSLKRVNSTKRIKKEICKRRSNFLGIENDSSETNDEFSIPPPPALEQILKAERELDRESRKRFEEATTERLILEENEIRKKEQEIIETLESEERQKQLMNIYDDFNGAKSDCTDTSEEINRTDILKEEKKTLGKEQIQLEETRLRSFEEKQLREREELLRKQEAHNSTSAELSAPLHSETTNLPNSANIALLSAKTKPYLYESVINGDGENITLSSESALCEDQNKSEVLEKTGISNKPAVPPKPIKKKEAIRKERERLRQEQEALVREREEHRRKLKEEEEQLKARHNSNAFEPPVSRIGPLPSLIKPAFTPQLTTPISAQPRENVAVTSRNFSAAQNGNMNDKCVEPIPRAMSKRSKPIPPPKKTVKSELRNQQKVPSVKKQDPLTESKYNQNHWLIQEAEMRRISELKERQRASYFSNSQTHLAEDAVCSVSPKVPALPTSLHDPVQEKIWNHGPPNMVIKKYPPTLSSDQPLVAYPPSKPSRVVSLERPEQMLSVSGRKRCSHCNEELGRGAAMIIESLQLHYHIHCFQCCVCQAQLGNGSCGTDVRVRNNKLHCQNCYSNDEAGLKFSQV